MKYLIEFINDWSSFSQDRVREDTDLCEVITAEEEALVSIVDKQLVDRLEASAVWIVPLDSASG